MKRDDIQHLIDIADSINNYTDWQDGAIIKDWVSIIDEVRKLNPQDFPASSRAQFIRIQRDIANDPNPNVLDHMKREKVKRTSATLKDYLLQNTDMTQATLEDKFQSLKTEAQAVPNQDHPKMHGVLERAKMLIRHSFGNESHYVSDIDKIHWSPSVYTSGTDLSRPFENGRTRFLNLIDVTIEELKLKDDVLEQSTGVSIIKSSKVFIVHGHDNDMKSSVARVLTKLKLEPIILHEQANQGKTLIEKFEKHSDVGFAIILVSPDDRGGSASDDCNSYSLRARQNVVLELGYFYGKLGRDRVLVLQRQALDFEIPTDILGIVYEPYDAAGKWEYSVGKELKASGYPIDLNNI